MMRWITKLLEMPFPVKQILLISALLWSACQSDKSTTTEIKEDITVFNSQKWQTKEGLDYPYREAMVNDVLYNDSIRSLSKTAIINYLGKADRENEGHLYYTISETRVGLWPLKTKTLVIKFSSKDSVEWIKLHGG